MCVFVHLSMDEADRPNIGIRRSSDFVVIYSRKLSVLFLVFFASISPRQFCQFAVKLPNPLISDGSLTILSVVCNFQSEVNSTHLDLSGRKKI